jgi:hypothetical protein
MTRELAIHAPLRASPAVYETGSWAGCGRSGLVFSRVLADTAEAEGAGLC